MIIGLSGTLSSGKDTVSEYLEKNEGFQHISLSQVLRDLAREKRLEVNLENLTQLGNSILADYGRAYLVKKAEKQVDFSGDVVISSIRQPNEIEYLKTKKNFFMIFVDAQAKIRFERSVARNRRGDSQTLEEFIAIEKKEIDGKSGGMDLNYCKDHADYVLLNNGTMEEFKQKIQQILGEIRKKTT
jgi:dephospho-CoA kinase